MLKERKNVGFSLSMKGFPPYGCGILGHQDRECRKVHKGCLSTNEGELQFGPWMCAVAPKTAQRKGSPGQSKLSEDDKEDAQGSDKGDEVAQQLIIHHQPSTVLMTARANIETIQEQLENPKQLIGLNFSNFLSPIQNSNLEWDIVAFETTPTKVLDSSLFSKSNPSSNP